MASGGYEDFVGREYSAVRLNLVSAFVKMDVFRLRAGEKPYFMPFHQSEQSAYNLHGVLRLRKNALVVLRNQLHAFVLEPRVSIGIRKRVKQPFHQSETSRIDLLKALYVGKRVCEVASPSASYGNLGERLAMLLNNGYLCRWIQSFYFDRGEATCCPGSDYYDVHVRDSAFVFCKNKHLCAFCCNLPVLICLSLRQM